jgi:hypothetical protein
MTSNLSETTITFGKYKDLSLSAMLRDRKYCAWLLQQDWFEKQYEFLHNRVKEHNPLSYFTTKPPLEVKPSSDISEFVANYPYFHLCPASELKLPLSDTDRKCYEFYLSTIQSLQDRMLIGNIKAPSSWLKKFEDTYSLSRDSFKDFLSAHDLPNIPYIVEDIKKLNGVEYKGAKSFIIAKNNSLQQEKFWEDILKLHFGEDIGTQYKFKNCFFDFIHIKSNTLYECKLNFKDFNEDQHNKYISTLGCFNMIYLISKDCIVDLTNQIIYTLEPDKYQKYFRSVKEPNRFESLIANFPIVELSELGEFFARDAP